MQELLTPSMHRSSKGGQGKRINKPHDVTPPRNMQQGIEGQELSPAGQTAPRNAMTLKDRRAGDPSRGKVCQPGIVSQLSGVSILL